MLGKKAKIKSLMRKCWLVIPEPVRKVFVKVFLISISDREQFEVGMPTVLGLLENVRTAGFVPQTILDVGANVGNWSRMASAIFPSAAFYMFEANPECEPQLVRARSFVGKKAKYAIMLLGPHDRDDVTFFKVGASSGEGSSVLPELTSFSRTAVTLPMRTLDGFMDGQTFSSPLVIKIDVQGFELEVLRGGRKLLASAELVILEAALLPYNEGSPLLGDVSAFMAEEGFVIFDFCGQHRRESDQVLFQIDVAFVKRDSVLRSPKKFWLREP